MYPFHQTNSTLPIATAQPKSPLILHLDSNFHAVVKKVTKPTQDNPMTLLDTAPE